MIGTDFSNRAAAVRSREDLVDFIRELVRDYHENREHWENATLDQYVAALAAWAEDMDGYFRNRGEPVPQSPSWNTIAMMLLAARQYE